MKVWKKGFMAALAVSAAFVCIGVAGCTNNESTQAELKIAASNMVASESPAEDLGTLYSVTGYILSLYDDGTYILTVSDGQYADWGHAVVTEKNQWMTGTYTVSLEDEYGMSAELSIPSRVIEMRLVNVMPDKSTLKASSTLTGEELTSFMEAFPAKSVEIDYEMQNTFTFVE